MIASTSGKRTYVHATAVKIGTAGLLIRGPSRAGKSSLALALLEEAARISCYGRLIGDDRVSLERSGENLVLRGHPRISGQIERRGQGIIKIPWVPSAIANYAIDLRPDTPGTFFEAATICLETVTLPLFTLARAASVLDRAKLLMALIQDAYAPGIANELA